MKKKYYCEICNEEFDNELQCTNHENTCNPETSYTCTCCGKTETWKQYDANAIWNLESWHTIHLGRQGYGSGLDGCDVDFELCDDCLCKFISTFVHKKEIYNSGSNYWYDESEID